MNFFKRKPPTLEQRLHELSNNMMAQSKIELFNIDAELESLQARRDWTLKRIKRLEAEHGEGAKVTQIDRIKNS